MKKLTIMFGLVSIFYSFLSAGPFDDFKQYFQQSYFKPFVKDFGGIVGANDFSSARTLGFPGFDVGLSLSVQSAPSSENKILKDSDVGKFGVPLIHVSAAIPFAGMDVVLRGFDYSDLKLIGGGLRYNIFKSGIITKFMPDLSAIFYYDSIDFKYFDGNHFSFNLVGSWDLPVIKPFIGAGFDRTKLKTKNIGSGFDGISESASALRYTLGLRFCPLPLVYVYGAYSNLHSEDAYNFGLGVKF